MASVTTEHGMSETPARTVYLPYRVAYADTDQMGVVYYGNFYVVFERARSEWLRQFGRGYNEWEAAGVGLPVVESRCYYHRPAHFDDLLTLQCSIAPVSGVRVHVDCAVCRDGDTLATGYTIHACVSLQTHRPARIPRYLLGLE